MNAPSTRLNDSKVALLAAIDAAGIALRALPTSVDAYRLLDDQEVTGTAATLASLRDSLSGPLALVAGEIARRSAPELGSQGLAQRTGFRTPEELVKITTRVSGSDAGTAVRLGRLINDVADGGSVDAISGELVAPTEPWLAPLASAVSSGWLSWVAAEAIRRGIGRPTSGVTVEQLLEAVGRLCRDGATSDPDRLARRAREVRDELDAGGVALRQEERRQQRSLRLFLQADGMGRLTWLLDPETLAGVKDLLDRATSPKLGGVRFVQGRAATAAEAILGDERTPVQLASDAFAQLLSLGADANPHFLIGSGAPVVKVIATQAVVSSRKGFGRIEGQTDPVSVATIERLRCAGSTVGMIFDEKLQPLDLGREQRLYSKRQRAVLAVSQGGCMAPGCDRPPSWCEVHHIRFWARDGGATDIRDGILLCKHHHLLFHNNGWEIERDPDNRFWLIPPVGVDVGQIPRLMNSKSAAVRDLMAERAAATG
jgi:hypothetical protein